ARKCEKKQVEPDGLVEVRLQVEGEGCAAGVPDAVVIRRLNAEGVLAGGNVGVVSRAARAGFGPLVIEALEHIAIPYLLRSGEAEAGVVELEVVMPGWNLEIVIVQRLIDIVHGEAHQSDGRRNGVDGEVRGVDFHEALGSSEPEQAIAGAPCRRMAV